MLPEPKNKIIGGNHKTKRKAIPVKKFLGPNIPENHFFVFVEWCGLDFKSQKKQISEKKANQEKRQTCKTGVRTALLSVCFEKRRVQNDSFERRMQHEFID